MTVTDSNGKARNCRYRDELFKTQMGHLSIMTIPDTAMEHAVVCRLGVVNQRLADKTLAILYFKR